MSSLTWDQRIRSAKKRNAFTVDDRVKVRDWNSCAVGELNLLEKSYDANYDPEVYRHGHMFTSAVMNNQIDKAKEILKELKKIKKEKLNSQKKKGNSND